MSLRLNTGLVAYCNQIHLKAIFLIATSLILVLTANTAYAVTLQVRTDSPDTSWFGSYGDSSGQTSVDGNGNKDIDMSGCDIYSAVFQIKSDGGTLTVNVLDDSGGLVDSKNTSAQFGVVSVSGQC